MLAQLPACPAPDNPSASLPCDCPPGRPSAGNPAAAQAGLSVLRGALVRCRRGGVCTYQQVLGLQQDAQTGAWLLRVGQVRRLKLKAGIGEAPAAF